MNFIISILKMESVTQLTKKCLELYISPILFLFELIYLWMFGIAQI